MLDVTLGVMAVEEQAFAYLLDVDIDGRGLVIGHPVLERIFHKWDEHQRHDHNILGASLGHIKVDVDHVGVAQLHQVQVLLEEDNRLVERHRMITTLIEQVAHHPGHIYNAVLCLLGVNIHQCMDVVERVHDEVRVDLVTQVAQLLLEALFPELCQVFLLGLILVIGFDTQVRAEHQDDNREHRDVVLIDGRTTVRRRWFHPVYWGRSGTTRKI